MILVGRVEVVKVNGKLENKRKLLGSIAWPKIWRTCCLTNLILALLVVACHSSGGCKGCNICTVLSFMNRYITAEGDQSIHIFCFSHLRYVMLLNSSQFLLNLLDLSL